MKWHFCFALFFFFPAFAVFAEPLILEDRQGEYSLGHYVQILEDPSGKLTIHDVISPEFSQKFVPSDTDVPNFGFTTTAYWVRFEIVNVSQKKDWLLEVGYPLLDAIDLYFPVDAGFFQKKQAGDRFRFDKRELKHQNFVFYLPPLPVKATQFYLRVQTSTSLLLPLKIWSNNTFFEKQLQQQYVFGIYYGTMLVMVAYNLFLFVSIRHRSYLFYVLYILSFIGFQMYLDGSAYQYLWHDFPQWTDQSWSFLVGLCLFWTALFTQSFLQTAQYTPLLHKMLYGVVVLSAVTMSFVFLPVSLFTVQFTVLLVLLAVVIAMTAAVLCWKRGYQPARFYLLGWSVLAMGAVARVLVALGILPQMFLTEYGVQIGSALEVVLLSLALADRFKRLEREKLQAQTEKLEAQNTILEKEREYRELVGNLNAGIFRLNNDPEGSLAKANAAALQIFGYEGAEGAEISKIYTSRLYHSPQDGYRVLEILKEQKEFKNEELQMRRKDGRVIWVSLNLTAFHDAEGKFRWIDGIVEDITHRKESEAKIQRLSSTFEKFVPQQFLKRIAQKGIDQIELGQAQTESLSVLFADIRAFTELSESVSPQELLDFLNTYLAEMNQSIQNCHGFIDKFIGDGIMALFDRPTHSTDSFHSSVAMTQAIRAFNEEYAKENLPPISIGIAIHSGNAIIGTVGTQERMDSTVLGDTVNLAARMEGLTKYYNAQIIISSDTREDIEDKSLLCRELDFIAVKGKQIPKKIFEVFNGNEAHILEKKQQILVPYAEGLSRYRARHWKEAIGLFEECLSIYPEDVVSQIYIERCLQFQKTPPDAHWRGETKMH